MHLIRRATNTTVASNYAQEGVQGEPSIMAMDEAGPIIVEDDEPTNPASGLIMTKTHCHGYCSLGSCGPSYIHNPRSFEIGCRTRMRHVVATQDGSIARETDSYDAERVKKAIHLIRHPLDNVVSRFHHERNRAKKDGDAEFEVSFPNNQIGFQNWCNMLDEDRSLFQIWPVSVDRDLKDKMRNVPCYSEFFKYVQWVGFLHLLAACLCYGVPLLCTTGILNRIYGFFLTHWTFLPPSSVGSTTWPSP